MYGYLLLWRYFDAPFPYHTDSETISYFITLNAAIVSSLGGNILRSISLRLVELLFKGTVLFPVSN